MAAADGAATATAWAAADAVSNGAAASVCRAPGVTGWVAGGDAAAAALPLAAAGAMASSARAFQ